MDSVYVKCHTCRKSLFKKEKVLDHVVGLGQSSFSWKKREKREKLVVCTSFFVDESVFNYLNLSETEGKITCPHCKSKIGSWNWSGAQCSCGFWQCPAFQ